MQTEDSKIRLGYVLVMSMRMLFDEKAYECGREEE